MKKKTVLCDFCGSSKKPSELLKGASKTYICEPCISEAKRSLQSMSNQITINDHCHFCDSGDREIQTYQTRHAAICGSCINDYFGDKAS